MRYDTHKTGMTIVEALVFISIFLMISFAASALFTRGLHYNSVLWENLEKQTEGRRVLLHMRDSARRAEDSSIGSYAIASADEYEFIFYANVDDDSARERVRFFLESNTIQEGIIHATGTPLSYPLSDEIITTLATDVVNVDESSPVFLYYDTDYSGTQAALTQPVPLTDIRGVHMTVTLEKDPTETPVPLTVETFVSLRNVKDN